MGDTLHILDLYSGVGGLSLGFVLALKDASILGLDIDRAAVEAYNYNLNRLGAKAVVQDVLEWGPAGDYDIVVGGSPCQPFSAAVNPRYGKVGEKHPLYPTFPRFFDVVLELKPKAFLFENVKGLVSSRHRHLLKSQVERARGEYRVAYRVLDASRYGVPQRRERLFVLGIRRDLGLAPSFPPETHAPEPRTTLNGRGLAKWVAVREAIGDLLNLPVAAYPEKLVQTNPRHGKPLDVGKPSRVVKVDGRGGDFTFDTMLVPLTPEQVERIRREREDASRHYAEMEFPDNIDKPSRTVSSHTVEGTKRETIVVPVPDHVMTPAGGWASQKSEWGSRVMDGDRPAYTITEKHRSGQLVEALAIYRRLTVRECLRLQSFPDWYRFPESISISRKYKLVGEAVPPILAYRLAIHLGKLLGLETREPPEPGEWQLPYFRRAFQDYGGSDPHA